MLTRQEKKGKKKKTTANLLNPIITQNSHNTKRLMISSSLRVIQSLIKKKDK